MNDRLKRKLDENEFAFGVHCSTTDLGFYEMACAADVDYIWIDTEHSPMTVRDVYNAVIVTQLGGASAVVRVPKCDPVLAKPYLDMGADGIVFPMVNSPEEAEAVVRGCKYPMRGDRGFGPIRANGYGDVGAEKHIERSNAVVIPIIQIEHHLAVERIDEILSVEGVEYAVLGHMDLSSSVGKAGRLKDPEVDGMIREVFSACKRHGVKLGMSLGIAPELYDFGRNNGASFISMGNQYSFYREGLIKTVKARCR